MMILVHLLALAALAQTPDERTAHWYEDLLVPSTTLSAGQKDFEKLYPRFQADREALEGDIPKLSDSEVVLRVMKMIAGANVAHNAVRTPMNMGFAPRLPLTFYWYADGVAVAGASEEYTAAVHSRVLKIGEKTPEQVVSELAPYVSHENQAWLRPQALSLLRCKAVLEHLGLAGSDGRVALTLQKPDGTSFPLEVRPVLLNGTPRKTQERYHWYKYLGDSLTLYVRYNICRSDPDLPFSEFAAKVLADADAHRVKRVVIDLRGNSGGNSVVINPLKNGLHARKGKLGRFYVLIGPSTFSSGLLNAEQLRNELHAHAGRRAIRREAGKLWRGEDRDFAQLTTEV
jgi:hypothetical protein